MRILVAVLVLALPCLGQGTAKRRTAATTAPKPAVSADSFPLLSLKVTGNHLYTQQQIIAAAGLKLGSQVSKAALDGARARLIETGAFESVGFEFGPTEGGKGYAGTFSVVEVEQLYPFRFEELPGTDQQLRAFLAEREPLFRDKIPGTKELLNRMAAEVEAFVAPRGFKGKVIANIAADRPGELTVLFRPAAAPPAIADVQFSGNQAVPAAKLQNALGAVAVGVPYREAAVRQLLDTAVRPVYDGRGRLKVNFTKIETEKAKDVDGVRVKIQVEEGPVYTFGAIRSAVPDLTPKHVLKMATFKTGDVANFDLVATVIDGIQKELRHDGYMRSHTQAERVLHDQEKTVDITFTSIPGTQFLMGKLTIDGLDVVSEPPILKLWSMKEGGPFNADYPQMFLDRVKEDGYLDNLLSTRYDQSINEKTSTVDVTLHFRGGTEEDREKQRRKREKEQREGGGPPVSFSIS